ncbi:acetylxylan esterase [Mucilaginibacter ginsenosidivorax]|uniref:Acetylxylan esterase n=1 Tax=Mucilaginibacter ginsenosidivorax TaxID=862126 RepID=A0A5B8W9A6_9SPHI|nr:acetylxylan esterase [Mucilaginibacter ginsenosidivorax]QEC79482.1 acetylxylan esterase [Mucilaginibacter ginsenosidivorax]
MNIKHSTLLLVAVFVIFAGLRLQAQRPPGKIDSITENDTVRSIAPFFTPATASKKAPNAEGFIQRWLLLEPINKSIRSNLVFTVNYMKTQFETDYFPNQFTVIPRNGEKVKVGEQELLWHALESPNFNIKLFRLAYGLRKQTYAVLFWAVTIVNSPREIKNVRLAVGSNGGSMWWLNGTEAVILDGDRRMVMDDCVSLRLTLNKGKNIIRGAVINGPGLSDFCVRLLDEKGAPIKDVSITLQ